MQKITLTVDKQRPPTRSHGTAHDHPHPKVTHYHPTRPTGKDGNNANLTFVGTATTLLHFPPLTIMTDPNFLHAGDHVHLGPGVTGTRLTEPSLDIHELPNIDLVLLSHYHADHFDQKVEAELRRDLPIITTVHAKSCLYDRKEDGEKFTEVSALETWETMMVDIVGSDKAVRITAMPGKHVPPGILEQANDLVGAVGLVIEPC